MDLAAAVTGAAAAAVSAIAADAGRTAPATEVAAAATVAKQSRVRLTNSKPLYVVDEWNFFLTGLGRIGSRSG